MSIDKAASAFEAAMTGGNTEQETSETTGAVEPLFAERAVERDVEAGGDEEPLKGVDDKGAQKEIEGEDESEKPFDPEDAIYADEPDGKKPKKGEAGEDDEEDEDEEDDETADDDAEVANIDPDAVVEVTIDGKPSKVTFKEATAGYIRTQTFHQRLNKLNETQDAIREEAGKLLEDKKKTVARLEEIEETAKALLPKEPDWDKLFAEDAPKARKLQKDYTDFNKTLEDLATKRKAVQKEAFELSEAEITKYAKTEREKFEASNPHWAADPTKKAKDIAAMVRTARATGFTDPEIAQTLDSRMLGILLKASKYDRMMAARPKANPRGKTLVTPGAGRTRTAPKGVARSQAQLRKTGHVEDATAVFQDIISRG